MFDVQQRDVPEQLVLTEQRNLRATELAACLRAAMSRLGKTAQEHGPRDRGLSCTTDRRLDNRSPPRPATYVSVVVASRGAEPAVVFEDAGVLTEATVHLHPGMTC